MNKGKRIFIVSVIVVLVSFLLAVVALEVKAEDENVFRGTLEDVKVFGPSVDSPQGSTMLVDEKNERVILKGMFHDLKIFKGKKLEASSKPSDFQGVWELHVSLY